MLDGVVPQDNTGYYIAGSFNPVNARSNVHRYSAVDLFFHESRRSSPAIIHTFCAFRVRHVVVVEGSHGSAHTPSVSFSSVCGFFPRRHGGRKNNRKQNSELERIVPASLKRRWKSSRISIYGDSVAHVARSRASEGRNGKTLGRGASCFRDYRGVTRYPNYVCTFTRVTCSPPSPFDTPVRFACIKSTSSNPVTSAS